MPSLRTGSWNIVGNGYVGVLEIRAIDAQGRLSGTAYGQAIRGWWDEEDGRISFLRIIDPADPTSYQAYDGYLWDDLDTQPGRNYRSHLAGSFDTFAGAGGSATRPTYGWQADLDVVG